MDPLRSFGFLLKDVSRLSSLNFEREAAAMNLKLTIAQCKILIWLQGHEGISQARLAEYTGTDPMTLVRVLDRMEGDGWLERRPDPTDRRARRLYLKPAAEPVIVEIWRIADRARAAALAGLGAAERSQLVSLLQRVHDNLLTLLPDAGEGQHPCPPPLAEEPVSAPAKTAARAPIAKKVSS